MVIKTRVVRIDEDFYNYTQKFGKELDVKAPGLLPPENTKGRDTKILRVLGIEIMKKQTTVDSKFFNKKKKTQAFKININFEDLL